ncbi:MAG: hypothetical protein MUE38_04490 [Flavihumibacter sp.]|jgi:AraC-like DNA-binding protein|nr:hypothetical protein [Flavihumibacter sp.]
MTYKKRLELAYHQLAIKNKRPVEVYLKPGFENLSHFIYVFKKQFELTPTVPSGKKGSF